MTKHALPPFENMRSTRQTTAREFDSAQQDAHGVWRSGRINPALFPHRPQSPHWSTVMSTISKTLLGSVTVGSSSSPRLIAFAVSAPCRYGSGNVSHGLDPNVFRGLDMRADHLAESTQGRGPTTPAPRAEPRTAKDAVHSPCTHGALTVHSIRTRVVFGDAPSSSLAVREWQNRQCQSGFLSSRCVSVPTGSNRWQTPSSRFRKPQVTGSSPVIGSSNAHPINWLRIWLARRPRSNACRVRSRSTFT